MAQTTNSFPSVSEVLQGRVYSDPFQRDVAFLRGIHDRYSEHWADLLQANITLADYVQSPAKLLRFINELGVAMRDRNDVVAVTNLAVVTSDEQFFTNADAYHPEILRAAAQAMMAIGTNGRRALALSFSKRHYQIDPQSLEELAKTVADEKSPNPELAEALAAMAFDFSTTNGGSYPECTAEAVKNLMCLPSGNALVSAHLNTNEIFADPVRFQAVIDGIDANHATELASNLNACNAAIGAKLVLLTNYPGAYRDALQDLAARIQQIMANTPKSQAR